MRKRSTQGLRWRGMCRPMVLGAMLLWGAGWLPAQTSAAPAVAQQGAQQGAQQSTTTPAPIKRKVRRRTTRTQSVYAAAPAAPSAPAQPNPAAEAQQRAADAKLLAQQQAQSDKAAKINDEQVRRAQQRQDAQQNEVRIQDAPGPAQTGVVPAAGPPVQPPQQPDQQIQDQRIQDQPSAVPGQNPAPQTPPQI